MICRIFKSTYFYSIISKGLHILLGVFISVFVNRALGTELKGEYVYMSSLISILGIVGGIGIYQMYPFYVKNKKLDLPKKKFINLTLQICSIYILVISIISLYIFCKSGSYAGWIFLISSLIIVFSISSTQLLMFASVEDFKKSRLANMSAYILKFIAALCVFLLFEKNIIAVLVADLCFNFISTVLYLKILQFNIGEYRLDWRFVWEIVKKGWVPMLFSLLLTLNYKIDVIYMKAFTSVSLSAIGLYSVGIQLAEYVWTIPDIFKEVLYSKTAKQTNVKETLWCMRLSLWVELVFLVFIFLVGEELLVLLYGENFAEAITITKFIFAGVLAMTIFKVLTSIYNASGAYIANLLILLSSVLINVIMNMVLIPIYATTGAAVASVIGYSVCGIVYLIRFCKDYKVPIYKALVCTPSEFKELFKGGII